MKLKPKHWQIIWEILAHFVSGVLLVFFFIEPSFKLLGWFMVIEYVTEMINAISYWRWTDKLEKKLHE